MSESERPAPEADENASASDKTTFGNQPVAADAPKNSRETPRERFEQQVAARRDSLDDHEPEETLWTGRYSPKAMVGWWLTTCVISVGLIVAAFLVSGVAWYVWLGILVIVWALVASNYFRMRLGFHYELTSQRFIHKTGLLTRRSDRIEVIDIDDVSYQQGPVQRLFGVGTINITSSDRSDPELCLLGIDKVSEISGLIDDVRRTERRRRSLHIESI